MSRYVVILTDDEQGYQDIEVLGSFGSLRAANEFAAKAQQILTRAEEKQNGGVSMMQYGVVVSLVQPARLRAVREWVKL